MDQLVARHASATSAGRSWTTEAEVVGIADILLYGAIDATTILRALPFGVQATV